MWRWILARLRRDRRPNRPDRPAHVEDARAASSFGQTVIALVDALTHHARGVSCSGSRKPAAIFMLTFFGAYIPYVGAFLSGLTRRCSLAVGDSGLASGVVMLTIVIVVQILEGNVLQPWIQGRAVSSSTRSSIAFAVTAGGAL